MRSAGEEMRESGECGRAQARAERDETRRVRVRGASLLRGSPRSRVLYLGRAGRTDLRARPANSCSQVSQLPHTCPTDEGESVSGTFHSSRRSHAGVFYA